MTDRKPGDMHDLTTTRCHVKLTCGHEFDEHRPAGFTPPVDDELRVCGHPDHYPAQYPATYSNIRPGDQP